MSKAFLPKHLLKLACNSIHLSAALLLVHSTISMLCAPLEKPFVTLGQDFLSALLCFLALCAVVQ